MKKLKIGDKIRKCSGETGVITGFLGDTVEAVIENKSVSYLYDDEFEPLTSSLNPKQQIILDWLVSEDHPSYTNIFNLFSDLLEHQVPNEVGEAFTEMMTDQQQQLELLLAYAQRRLEEAE